MPEETPPEITDKDLRDIAAQMDAGSLDPESEVDIKSATTAGQEAKKPEGSENPEGTTEVTPSQEQSASEEGTKESEAQKEIDFKSEYERLKKEQDRKDRSWQRLNEEKDALAKLKATTRADETRIAGDQFSAEEYEAYAEKVIEEGGADAVKVAKQAMTKAKEIRQGAFQEKWQQSVKEAIDENPELADQESELSKSVQNLLKDPNWANLKSAVKIAKSQQLVDSIPGLNGEIENYKKEIERLNKAMEVGGKPNVPKRDAPKKFEDMDMKEAGAYLRQRAEEADANAY